MIIIKNDCWKNHRQLWMIAKSCHLITVFIHFRMNYQLQCWLALFAYGSAYQNVKGIINKWHWSYYFCLFDIHMHFNIFLSRNTLKMHDIYALVVNSVDNWIVKLSLSCFGSFVLKLDSHNVCELKRFLAEEGRGSHFHWHLSN